MSKEQIIVILRRMREERPLTFEERAALAWCIAKLEKEKDSE